MGGGGNRVVVLVIAICLLTAPSLLVRAKNFAEQKLRKQGPPITLDNVDAKEGMNENTHNQRESRQVEATMSNNTNNNDSGLSDDDIAVIGVIGTFIGILVAIIGIIVMIIICVYNARRHKPAGEVHEHQRGPLIVGNPFTNVEEAKEEQDQLEGRFQELSSDTRKVLDNNKVSVNRFGEVITGIPVSLKKLHKTLLHKTLPELLKADSLHKAFIILNAYMDFLNYEILDHIIAKFGDNDMKQKMEAYKQDLKLFRMRMPLVLYIRLCQANPRNYDYYCCRPVVFHLSEFWTTGTLEDVYQLRHSFASHFYLNTTWFAFHHMRAGSVVMTWLIPSSIAQDLSEDIQQDETGFMSEQRALQVTVDGTIVYEQPPKIPSDFVVFTSKPDPEELREWVVSKIKDDQEVRQGVIASLGGPPVNAYFDPRRHSLVDALNVWRETPKDKSWVDIVEILLQDCLRVRTQMAVNNLYDQLSFKHSETK